jgi:hypothetical protein
VLVVFDSAAGDGVCLDGVGAIGTQSLMCRKPVPVQKACLRNVHKSLNSTDDSSDDRRSRDYRFWTSVSDGLRLIKALRGDQDFHATTATGCA